ncbi:MAG: PaaI family thioesterase [Candidatus Dormibacteraeota bacterium]|nr:PaaI family thioesterase [Candidatus Dormibacteraeota bacterium]
MSSLVTLAELQALLDGVAFTSAMGMRVVSLGDAECVVRVPFRREFERPGGIVSGQVYMNAADVAAWCAIKTRLGLDDGSTTSNLETAFLAAAREEDVLCTARVLKFGRRLVYGVAECRSEAGRLLTHHSITYARG